MMDAIVSLFIWSTCVLFFLPLYTDLRQQLVEAKRALHVAEVMEHAARTLQMHDGTGTHRIDDTIYAYSVRFPTICVTYTAGSEAKKTCENFSNNSEDLQS